MVRRLFQVIAVPFLAFRMMGGVRVAWPVLV